MHCYRSLIAISLGNSKLLRGDRSISNIPIPSGIQERLNCWGKETFHKDFLGKKMDINSLPMDRPSMRSMVVIRVLNGSFLERVKSAPGDFAYFDRFKELISRRSNVFRTLGFIVVYLLVMSAVALLQGPLLLAPIYGQ